MHTRLAWRLGLLLAALWTAAQSLGQGGSLSGPGSSFVTIYSDRKATRVGDLLTVIINETVTGNAQAQRQHSNTTDAEVTPGVGYLGIIPALAHKASSASDQSGRDSRAAGVTARVTVKVVEMTPEGNLVVEGTRTIAVGKDHQEVYVRGEVRPDDIPADNVIYSHYLANAEVRIEGTDPRYPGTKVGLMTRIINWLF